MKGSQCLPCPQLGKRGVKPPPYTTLTTKGTCMLKRLSYAPQMIGICLVLHKAASKQRFGRNNPCPRAWTSNHGLISLRSCVRQENLETNTVFPWPNHDLLNMMLYHPLNLSFHGTRSEPPIAFLSFGRRSLSTAATSYTDHFHGPMG